MIINANLVAKIIKYGVYISFFSLFIISTNTFFPFIVGKYTFFRVAVEILFLLYLFLAVAEKCFRPQLSKIVVFLSLFIIFGGFSVIFGVDPSHSFWSNYERMEGYLSLIHYFLFFVIIAGVFKEKKDFESALKVFYIVTLLVALYGIFQKLQLKLPYIFLYQLDRIGSTLGNPAYLGTLMMFGIFFGILIIYISKNLIGRIFVAIGVILEFIVLNLSATRGAFLGLAGSILILLILSFFSNLEKKYKKILAAILCFSVLISIFLFILKETPLIKNIYPLYRIINFDFASNTIKSRYLGWQMAFNGFLQRPLFGWGPENYLYIFNQYFIPDFKKYEGASFDRAHSVIFDTLTSYGLVGLILILLLWYFVLKQFFYEGRRTKDFYYYLFFGVMIAYIIQAIFIFDVLSTVIPLFLVFGFAHFLFVSQTKELKSTTEYEKDYNKFSFPLISFLIISFIFILIVIVPFNFKPLFANLAGVKALVYFEADINKSLEYYKEAIAYNTYGNKEIELNLFRKIFSYLKQRNKNVSYQDLNQYTDKVLSDMEKYLKNHPRDLDVLLSLGEVYNSINTEVYLNKAKLLGEQAKILAPKRKEIYNLIIPNDLYRKDYVSALQNIKEGMKLYPDDADLEFYYGAYLYLTGDIQKAEEVFQKISANRKDLKQQIENFKSSVSVSKK